MRRIVACQVLMLSMAAMCLVGCSSSPTPEVAENKSATPVAAALPNSPHAAASKAGENGGHDPTAISTRKESPTAERADGSDTDEAHGDRPRSAGALPPLDQQALGDGSSERNGRSDGDDPAAPQVVPQIAESQDEEPLDNGREATAQPIPEGQRVAAAPQNDELEPLEVGRTPHAEPRADSASPLKAPTSKPAAPSRETLSDLPKSIQSLDKDGDGQLGVYEWPREKLATFKTLDANKDGFLTPAELIAGQKKQPDAESSKGDKQPAAGGEAKAEEEAATKTEDGSRPNEASGSATDATEKTETPGTTANGADGKDDSNAGDQPKSGS